MLDESINFVILWVSGLFNCFYSMFLYMENPVRKHVDPDQTPHHVAPDLGLQWLTMTLLRVFPVTLG